MFTTIERHGGVTYKVHRHADPQAIYDEVNAKFFGGTLPRYTCVFESDENPMPDVPSEWAIGACDHETQTIVVRGTAEMHDRLGGLRGVILHEACHVATRDEIEDHGPRFQSELQRVTRPEQPQEPRPLTFTRPLGRMRFVNRHTGERM